MQSSSFRGRRDIPASLTGAKGDPARGRAIVANRQVGLCLLCHSGPFPEERFQGNLAPDLRERRRAADAKARSGCASSIRGASNPGQHHAGLLPHRGPRRASRRRSRARPILSAEQIEDVVAYLVTLEMTLTMTTRREFLAARLRRRCAGAPRRSSPPNIAALRKAALEEAIRKVTGGAPVRARPGEARPAAADRQRQLRAADA